MDAHDGITLPKVAARPHEPIHAVLHLGVAPLHRVEVQRRVLRALDTARRGSPTDSDTVRRAADLYDEHSFLRLALVGVTPVHAPHAGREHNGLDPLESLPAGETLSEAPREAVYDRLAELVPVVGRAVGSLDLDLEGTREVRRVDETFVLPRQGVPGHVEVPHAVGANSRHRVRTPPGGHDIPQPAAGSGLGAGERRNGAREVVSLGREDWVQRPAPLDHFACLGELGGDEAGDLVPTYARGVVVEGDDGVVRLVLREGRLDHLEERVGLRLAIDDHLS